MSVMFHNLTLSHISMPSVIFISFLSYISAVNCKMISYFENAILVQVRPEYTILYAYYITEPFNSSFGYLYSCRVT